MARTARRPAARIGAAMTVAAAVAVSVPMGLVRGRGGEEPSSAATAAPARLIDLNVAGAEELALLPGIGPGIAGRIVSDRAGRGPFASVDELRRVKGIGTATLERIRPFATAGQAA